MRKRRAEKEAAGQVAPLKPQEPAPTLFPDMMWVWSAYCYLSERRGVGPNGPVAITIEAMNAYLELSNRKHAPYVQQVLHFIPILDREYLHQFYDKQAKEMEKARKKASAPQPRRGLNRR